MRSIWVVILNSALKFFTCNLNLVKETKKTLSMIKPTITSTSVILIRDLYMDIVRCEIEFGAVIAHLLFMINMDDVESVHGENSY